MCRTGNRLGLAAALVALSVWPGVAFAASSVTGTVTFEGKAPPLKPLTMDADPAAPRSTRDPCRTRCWSSAAATPWGTSWSGSRRGSPLGRPGPLQRTPAVLDQKGCQYVPHVQGIMVGQTYRILNSDGILHNVHALPKINKQFNRAMPATVKEATATFEKPEDGLPDQVRRPPMDERLRRRLHPSFLLGDQHGREVHNLGSRPGDLRDHRLAREAGEADRLSHRWGKR